MEACRNPRTLDVGLAAGKYTDSLLLRLAAYPPTLDLDMAGDQRLYVRAAYYSWGYLLRKAACDFLDVEPAELAVNIRPVTTDQGAVCEIVFFDSLENGAGYCRYLAERLSGALLQSLLPGEELYDRLVQDGHMHGCDSSCYDCLRDYNNTDLHALLDWRLGLDLARLALEAQANTDLQHAVLATASRTGSEKSGAGCGARRRARTGTRCAHASSVGPLSSPSEAPGSTLTG